MSAPDVQPGPCVVCKAEGYALSLGGPDVCPACDSGHSHIGLNRRREEEIERMRESLADRYFDAKRAYDRVEYDLTKALQAIFGEGMPFEDFHGDPSDWDGRSLEITDAVPGLVPTPEQLEGIWRLGFNVVRIEYVGDDTVSGSWWCVQGKPPGTCGHAHTPAEATV